MTDHHLVSINSHLSFTNYGLKATRQIIIQGLDKWVECITGRSPSDIQVWEEILVDAQIRLDNELDSAVEKYCNPSIEDHTGMLEPWCKLVNRVLELAHQIIPNLLPLVYDDLEFYAHHLLPFKAYRESKTLMAVIGLSRSRLRTWYNRDHASEQSSPRPTNIRQPNAVFRVNFDLAKCSFHEKRMHNLREAWREHSRAARETG